RCRDHGEQLVSERRAACVPDLAVRRVAEQMRGSGRELGRRLAALGLQMQHLAVKRKIVDPEVAGIGGSTDLDPDRITLSELRAAVIQTQAETLFSNEAGDAHHLQVCQRTAQRWRHDVDGHFRAPVWKQTLGELDQFGFLPGIRHGAGYAGGALRGNLAPQRRAVELRQRLIEFLNGSLDRRLLRNRGMRRPLYPRKSRKLLGTR